MAVSRDVPEEGARGAPNRRPSSATGRRRVRQARHRPAPLAHSTGRTAATDGHRPAPDLRRASRRRCRPTPGLRIRGRQEIRRSTRRRGPNNARGSRPGGPGRWCGPIAWRVPAGLVRLRHDRGVGRGLGHAIRGRVRRPRRARSRTTGQRTRPKPPHQPRRLPRPQRLPRPPPTPLRPIVPGLLLDEPMPGTSGTPERRSTGNTPPGGRARAAPDGLRHSSDGHGRARSHARRVHPRRR